MVKVSDCTCDCESAAEKEQIKERALSSINKIWTTDARTYYPDGTGMVTLPIPSADQITQMDANTELIKANTADITALNTEMEDVQGTVGKIPTGYTLYRNGDGKIMLQAEATDGSLLNSNTLDMIIPYQYDLISGTTDRSFKLQITMSDGSSYTTNDFIIPEGGGTDVTVTGIVLSKDTGDVNRFHVGINLSDGTMIDSGYISMIDSVDAAVADGKLTITVNGISSVPVEVATAEDVTNLYTIANRAFDAVSINGSELTLERGNGGVETVTLPSGGGEWEEVDLNNWPTDFATGDTVLISFRGIPVATASSWTTTPESITWTTGTYYTAYFRCELINQTSNTSTYPTFEPTTVGSKNALIIARLLVLSADSWNSGSLATVISTAFNAGGISQLSFPITTTNNKINKIYKLKK